FRSLAAAKSLRSTSDSPPPRVAALPPCATGPRPSLRDDRRLPPSPVERRRVRSPDLFLWFPTNQRVRLRVVPRRPGGQPAWWQSIGKGSAAHPARRREKIRAGRPDLCRPENK